MTVVPAIAGVVVDHIVGEPPLRWHPVASYGSLMSCVEQRIYADRRINGAVLVAVGAGVGIVAGLSLRALVGPRAATVVAVAVCSAGRMLDAEAKAIERLLAVNDLRAARQRLRSLVGRCTDDLDENGISRAVIESVAENSVDAVTATLLWAAIAGAPGALAHRAVNTLDAMVGHHDERYEQFGWASARLDDMVNHTPARLTALAVAVARPRRARAIWRSVRRDAAQHPSPNGGVIEAAYAAALDVQLGGINRYAGATEDRGLLGDGPVPNGAAIADALRLRRRSTAMIAALLLATAALCRPPGRLRVQ